jgi:hypothetical protein
LKKTGDKNKNNPIKAHKYALETFRKKKRLLNSKEKTTKATKPNNEISVKKTWTFKPKKARDIDRKLYKYSKLTKGSACES